MIQLLAQAQQASQNLLFGLSVGEWAILLSALAAFVEALRQRHGRIKATGEEISARNLAGAAFLALEEAAEAHPEAVRLTRRLARDKATKYGVETVTIEMLDLDEALEPKKKEPKK